MVGLATSPKGWFVVTFLQLHSQPWEVGGSDNIFGVVVEEKLQKFPWENLFSPLQVRLEGEEF